MALSQKQLEARRKNWSKRGPLTEASRERLRAAALKNRPWLRSSGPKSVSGKMRSRMNARKHGSRSAQRRATSVFLTMAGRLNGMIFLAYFAGDRLRPSKYCRYSATLRDYVTARRQAAHPLPATDDTVANTSWLCEHARLAEQPVEHGAFPFIEFARALNPQLCSAAVNRRNGLWLDSLTE